MVRKSLRVFRGFALLAVSLPAIAQYVATPQPQQTPTASPGPRTGDLTIAGNNGQTQEQQWADRYQCHRWATSQSGFDPTRSAAANPQGDDGTHRDQYRRAFAACMQGRGYTVGYGAPETTSPTPTPAPARGQATAIRQTAPVVSEVKYRPLAVQIEGGYSVAAGMTDRSLDDGSNVGLGLTWFPTSALPVGLRVDGSYSSFRPTRALLNQDGGFTSGHENIYGGDADLQLDLAHQSSRSKMYLFGGAGWYREETRLRQVSFEPGTVCGFYFCGSGFVPTLTAVDHTTSPWHSAWNAGLGWEATNAEGASFFVEARFLRIAPSSSEMQFVPIRVGLRF
jgi:hypothetical protein